MLPAATSHKSAYDKLPRRLKRFVSQYVAGDTPANAMRLAGYSGLHPRVVGHKWLKRPEVRAAVEEETERLVAEVGVRQVSVLRQMHAIASADPRKLVDENGQCVPLHRLDADIAAAISGVEVEEISSNGEKGTRYKYKFWDKVKANDRLGQFVKLWEARATNVNVDARSVTVNVDSGSEEAIRLLATVGSEIAALGSGEAAAAANPNGSLLPAPIRDGATGHRTPVDAEAGEGDTAEP
jgi:phage terminase small subunit